MTRSQLPDPSRRRVLLFGLGDLGRRLALGLAGMPEVGELVLVGRDGLEGRRTAALVEACGSTRVRFALADGERPAELEGVLRRELPDLVVHCATLLSPWHVPGRDDPRSLALARGGFALQLPAQLPLLRNLMTAMRTVGLAAPVVNAAFPDLTHPVLHALGLAPLVGLGNAAMIRARVAAVLRATGRAAEASELRVLAHHAHVTPVMRAEAPSAPGATRPRIYLGEDGRREDELAFAGPPLPSSRELNALPAATGLPVLAALLDPRRYLRTSLPGPRGLPGGYPVAIAEGRIELDLPPDLKLAQAIAFQLDSARSDGVGAIDDDGTVHFTDAAREAVGPFDPGVAEPLEPADARARFDRLRAFLDRP